MTKISMQDIQALRAKTGAGVLDCKNALLANDSNVEKSVDWLRKKGLASAAKKADRVAAEGVIGLAFAQNNNKEQACLIEVNCETDFVAKNAKFGEFVKNVFPAVIEKGDDVEAVKSQNLASKNKLVGEALGELVAVIGENIQIRRTAKLEEDVVAGYLHNIIEDGLGKIGVIVAIKTDGDKEKVRAIGKKIAMHISATRPQSLSIDKLDQKSVEREKDVLSAQAKASGKPDNVIEKMIEGRIRKFYSEVVLQEQPFVMDEAVTVSQFVKNSEKELGAKIEIQDFICFQLGEGIEKKEENFAQEVSAVAGGK